MTRPKLSERVGRTRTSHQSQTFSSSSPKADEIIFNRVEHVERVDSCICLTAVSRYSTPFSGCRRPRYSKCNSPSSTRSTCSTRLKIISSAFGDELEKVWDWCDVLVLPTLSENFGLVIAEALERGKRVITTDGAPAWGENLSRVEHAEHVEGGEILSGYNGRLIYLKGYRDGSDEERVELLKKTIERMCG